MFKHSEASANIIRFAQEGRLIQRAWHTEKGGRKMACLLGSIHPSVTSEAECNGDLMPMWLAQLTPRLFDSIPADKVTEIGLRYGSLVARWHVLTPDQWEAVKTAFLVRTVDAALSSAREVSSGEACWAQVEAACEQVKAALISGKGLKAARAAAEAARAAAEAAAEAAYGTAAEVAAEVAAKVAAGAAASYSLFTYLLDSVEAECNKHS